MVVITDDDDVVKEIALIPGNFKAPDGWHVYFPVIEDLPNIGKRFIPDFDAQPWLNP